ncbi:MAG TPA: SCO family protein [Betaproteobacteria bacterium]|nr:SCO family protein [Betaproteobacteria bacterium]
MKITRWISAALAVILLIAGGFYWLSMNHPSPNSAGAPQGGDFTLQSADGPRSLHDFRGKVVLLYFGYTFCPDICPTTLTLIGQALSSLSPAQQAQIQGIFVTVDPARDTAQKMKAYVRYFYPGLIGLTGNPQEIAAVARRYGVVYRKHKEKSGGYLIDHSAFIYLIGRHGKLRRTLPHGAPAAAIAAALRQLLQQP